MKFLVVRFSSIGDIVLTSPVIRCLKMQVPGAEVHFVTKENFRSVVAHNPHIDKVHVLSHSWELLMEELMQEGYDYVIDLHRNRKSARLKHFLKKKTYTFNKLNIKKYIYTAFKINLLPPLHIVDRYMQAVSSFNVVNDGAGLDYFIGKEDEILKTDIPASHLAGYVAAVIGAAHGTKRWPVSKWREFCASLEHPIILLGGKEDAANGELIATIDPVKIYNACGRFRLNESADIIRKSKIVITNDTGLMHIAAAFKKPVISLWGNTVPSFGMYPYYGNRFAGATAFDIVQVNKLWCRPCSKIGYDKCPLGHFKCMEKIDANLVLTKVRQRL